MGNLGEGIAMTITGIGTVFSVLIILYFLLIVMEKLFYKKSINIESIENKNISTVANSYGSSLETSTEVIEDEEEIVAVLTAAIAASLNMSSYNLRIKSFKRIGQSSPAWNFVGRKELLESKL